MWKKRLFRVTECILQKIKPWESRGNGHAADEFFMIHDGEGELVSFSWEKSPWSLKTISWSWLWVMLDCWWPILGQRREAENLYISKFHANSSLMVYSHNWNQGRLLIDGKQIESSCVAYWLLQCLQEIVSGAFPDRMSGSHIHFACNQLHLYCMHFAIDGNWCWVVRLQI